MRLNEYTTLGRTGLRVSPLCLGAMGFGTGWGWGADEKLSHQMLDQYVEPGGNFIDTADGYQMGQSEEIVGKYVAERGLRDKLAIATKFTFGSQPGNPNAGGNGRKNIYRALEGSLKRLKTDYIDLYYLHSWDLITPVEEVISTLTDLIREGKIRYYGLSDTPAWYFTRAQTLAEKGGLERCATLQLEYSLAERNIEREHIPAAQELGIGLCPWSPLAGGLLTGKYKREGATGKGEGRLTMPNPDLQQIHGPQLARSRYAARRHQADRQDARASRAELARHAAGRDLDHSRRDENRAARGQSRLARFLDSRGSAQAPQ